MAKKTKLQKKRNYKQKSATRVKKTRVKQAAKKRGSRKLYGGVTPGADKTAQKPKITKISEAVDRKITQKFDEEFVKYLNITGDNKTKMKSLYPKLKLKMLKKMNNREIEPYEYDEWLKGKFEEIAKRKTLKDIIQQTVAFSAGLENDLRQFHKDQFNSKYQHFLKIVERTKMSAPKAADKSDTEYLIEQYFINTGIDVLIEIGKLLKTREGLTTQQLMYYIYRVFYVEGRTKKIDLFNTELTIYQLTKTRAELIEDFKIRELYTKNNTKLLENENVFMFYLERLIKNSEGTTSLDELIKKVLEVLNEIKSETETETEPNLLSIYFTYLEDCCKNIKNSIGFSSEHSLSLKLMEYIKRINGKTDKGKLELFIVSYYFDKIANKSNDYKISELQEKLYNLLSSEELYSPFDKFKLKNSGDYECNKLYDTAELTVLPDIIEYDSVKEEKERKKRHRARAHEQKKLDAIYLALAGVVDFIDDERRIPYEIEDW